MRKYGLSFYLYECAGHLRPQKKLRLQIQHTDNETETGMEDRGNDIEGCDEVVKMI